MTLRQRGTEARARVRPTDMASYWRWLGRRVCETSIRLVKNGSAATTYGGSGRERCWCRTVEEMWTVGYHIWCKITLRHKKGRRHNVKPCVIERWFAPNSRTSDRVTILGLRYRVHQPSELIVTKQLHRRIFLRYYCAYIYPPLYRVRLQYNSWRYCTMTTTSRDISLLFTIIMLRELGVVVDRLKRTVRRQSPSSLSR